MKAKAKKALHVGIISMLIVVMLSVTCYAYSNGFSIPSGSKTWNGKNNGVLWGFDISDEVTWTLTNTTSANRTLVGKIYYVRTLLPDVQVGGMVTVTGGNGTSNTGNFVPYTDRGYYPVITDESKLGSTGTVSATQ